MWDVGGVGNEAQQTGVVACYSVACVMLNVPGSRPKRRRR